ncbi:MAG TPA: hypothetical protein VIH57_04765 [Bacteroidales bacterium]
MKAHLYLILFFVCMINANVSAAEPKNPEIENIYWKAVKYYQEEEYHAALLLFQHALSVNPENVELNYYVGMCYYNLNKPKLAKWYFSFAINDNCCRLKILLLARDSGSEDDLISYNQ